MDSKSFFGNWIVRNLIGAVVFVLCLVLVIDIALKIYTHHGDAVSVPDLTNMPVENAVSKASGAGLCAVVTDSVYVMRMNRGQVFSQNPKAGSRVKSGRKISLTINANQPRKVSIPLLVGYSMRQAKAELLSRGLMVGKLIYVRDMATNNVLGQQYRGRDIEPGTSIDMGAAIDLVVGLNESDGRTLVPDLAGMRYIRATEAVVDNSLNVGRLVFDATVRDYDDSLNATVYSQSPSALSDTRMGEKVTLYLTLDDSKVPAK